MTPALLAQATTPPSDGTGALIIGGIIVVGTLLWALVPVFISGARSRSTLVFWCWVFTLLATVIAIGGVVMSSTLGVIAGVFGMYAAAGVANLFWLMGLICGVGAALDKMAERRMQKMLRTIAETTPTTSKAREGLPLAPRAPHPIR